MLPSRSYYIVMGLGEAKSQGGIKVILWRKAEGVSHKVKGGGEHALFMGEFTLQVFYQNYLPILASFGLKSYMICTA